MHTQTRLLILIIVTMYKKKRKTAVLIIQIFIFYLKFYPLKNTCAPVAFSILYKEDNVICTEVIYRKCI